MASYQWTYPTVSMFETEYYFSKENVSYQAKVFPPHLHDRMELYVLLDGDVSFMVESKLYKLNPGDGLITKPNEMHNCILNTNSVHRHACFWFDVSNDFLFSDFLSRGFGENNLIVPKEQDKQRLFALLDLLKKASDTNDVNIPVKPSDKPISADTFAKYAPPTSMEIKYSNAASNMYKNRLVL